VLISAVAGKVKAAANVRVLTNTQVWAHVCGVDLVNTAARRAA
jgi:hypothetical protein